MSPFEQPISPRDVRSLIDLTVPDNRDTNSMATLQEEGIAALYGILCRGPVAVLADEVGMGKTYQALGLAAVVWNEQPDARILFVVPSEGLQVQWVEAYQGFFASNYRRHEGIGDDRAATVLFGDPVFAPARHPNLRSWVSTIGRAEREVSFLRHSSFTRPIYLKREDYADLGKTWSRTRQALREHGLFETEPPSQRLTPENASRVLNEAFAKAVNARLRAESGGTPYFDLVVVDESQSLRNPDNQTNTVLYEVLRDQVRKWLFLSATPAHGGPGDVPRILNRYPTQPAGRPLLDPTLADDPAALQRAMQEFVVRRQRLYLTRDRARKVGKRQYRKHDVDTLGVRDHAMSALGTLSMAVVQKGLVGVLRNRSNRFRIGFLSSFESLQTSLRRALGPSPTKAPVAIPAPIEGDSDEDEASGDWFQDRNDRVPELEAPDTEFVQRLAEDFDRTFGQPLPHPKVDAVVDWIAPRAFGAADRIGGQKFLVFVRRISTVDALRERLDRRYHQAVEERVRRVWRRPLDWERGDGGPLDDVEDDAEDPDASDATDGSSRIRRAMARGGWLYRFRQTFRTTGRHNLFFEDGWLRRLCLAGGVAPEEAAASVPYEVWAESWVHATRSAGAKQAHLRARRVRYLAVQLLRRAPEVFGLNAESARPWRDAYELVLHAHLGRETLPPGAALHRAPELFTEPTLWDQWDQAFPTGELALPVSDPARPPSAELVDLLCRRAVARTVLDQAFRLTDTLIDLYFADRLAKEEGGTLAERFLAWLREPAEPSAAALRRECEGWIQHLRVIADACLGGRGKSWSDLARVDNLRALDNPTAVMGVVGGSGANLMVTRQFRTPSLPRVVVCTDTLKQGVDLHLFCDTVLHYGVAWTSGDLEQRIGRVDRYFSQIERRLATEGDPPEVHLHVGYPHVVASLERAQVALVRQRQVQVEELMDSPLATAIHESRDLVVGADRPRAPQRHLDPFEPRDLPNVDRGLGVVPRDVAEGAREHYRRWTAALYDMLDVRGWMVTPRGPLPTQRATLGGRSYHELRWGYDAALRRYVVTLSAPACRDEDGFRGATRRRVSHKDWVDEGFHSVLVPTPDEGIDKDQLRRIVEALSGEMSNRFPEGCAAWRTALYAASGGHVAWADGYKATLTVPRGERKHRLTVYVYEGLVRVVGIVSPIDRLGERARWGGPATADHVSTWARQVTNDLTLGYLHLHPQDGLVFGICVLHPELTQGTKQRLIEEVAWRADAWEAALTGYGRL